MAVWKMIRILPYDFSLCVAASVAMHVGVGASVVQIFSDGAAEDPGSALSQSANDLDQHLGADVIELIEPENLMDAATAVPFAVAMLQPSLPSPENTSMKHDPLDRQPEVLDLTQESIPSPHHDEVRPDPADSRPAKPTQLSDALLPDIHETNARAAVLATSDVRPATPILRSGKNGAVGMLKSMSNMPGVPLEDASELGDKQTEQEISALTSPERLTMDDSPLSSPRKLAPVRGTELPPLMSVLDADPSVSAPSAVQYGDQFSTVPWTEVTDLSRVPKTVAFSPGQDSMASREGSEVGTSEHELLPPAHDESVKDPLLETAPALDRLVMQVALVPEPQGESIAEIQVPTVDKRLWEPEDEGRRVIKDRRSSPVPSAEGGKSPAAMAVLEGTSLDESPEIAQLTPDRAAVGKLEGQDDDGILGRSGKMDRHSAVASKQTARTFPFSVEKRQEFPRRAKVSNPSNLKPMETENTASASRNVAKELSERYTENSLNHALKKGIASKFAELEKARADAQTVASLPQDGDTTASSAAMPAGLAVGNARSGDLAAKPGKLEPGQEHVGLVDPTVPNDLGSALQGNGAPNQHSRHMEHMLRTAGLDPAKVAPGEILDLSAQKSPYYEYLHTVQEQLRLEFGKYTEVDAGFLKGWVQILFEVDKVGEVRESRLWIARDPGESRGRLVAISRSSVLALTDLPAIPEEYDRSRFFVLATFDFGNVVHGD